MNPFDFAIQMEQEGAAFYRELAGKSPNQAIQRILQMLADEEEKHARAVQAMAAELPEPAEAFETDVLTEAKNIFRRIRDFGEKFAIETEPIALYRQALEVEEKSRAFYLDRADQTHRAEHKRIFERLADEEAKHAELLDNLLEMISRPKQWLENAEFFHPEDY